MVRRSVQQSKRPGSAAVETAIVASMFLMFLIGLFEYCRFVMVNQLAENAVRLGARYAVVNSSDTNLVANTTMQVTNAMAGFDKTLANFTVSVYEADSNGNAMTSGTSYVSPANANFGQYIGVQIDLDFNPIGGNLLSWKTTHLTVKCLMFSEAN